MPTKDEHLAVANKNKATADYLLEKDEHLAWCCTVCFYRALHMIEALLAADPQAKQNHTDDHKERNRLLKSTNRYKQVWKHYQPLFGISMVARYLPGPDSTKEEADFIRYLSRKEVTNIVYNHYLHQLERSICKLLGDQEFFVVKSVENP